MSMYDDYLGADGTVAYHPIEAYAPSPLGMKTYGSIASLIDYTAFDTPVFVTRRVDLSMVSPLGMKVTWPFDITQVPINGFLFRPTDPGTYPLVVMVHGEYFETTNSARGYIYLAQHLASHGFIATTIDCGFLNQVGTGEMDARALMILEHIEQFDIWNNTPGHPLYKQVDLNNVLVMGHSRGGEAAVIASWAHRLGYLDTDDAGPRIPLDGSGGFNFGPYNCTITSIVAFAPTENSRFSPNPPWYPQAPAVNYLLVQGSMDYDVTEFPGQRVYDRALPIDMADPAKDAAGLKGLVFLIGGCHAYFNMVWDLDVPHDPARLDLRAYVVPESAQYRLAKACLAGFAYATVKGLTQYLPLYPPYRGSGVDTVRTVTQYQGARRLFLEHFEEVSTSPVISSPVTGSVTVTNTFGAGVRKFQDLYLDELLFQETRGLQLILDPRFMGGGARYELAFTGGADFSKWPVFQFRAAMGNTYSGRVPLPYRYSIEFSDGTNTATFATDSFMPTPWLSPRPGFVPVSRVVMQTIRIPLDILDTASPKVDRTKIASVALIFNDKTPVTLFMDDLQLTE